MSAGIGMCAIRTNLRKAAGKGVFYVFVVYTQIAIHKHEAQKKTGILRTGGFPKIFDYFQMIPSSLNIG